MPIRKTAAGKVIEIENDDFISKTAAADDPPWGDQDEQELAQENDQD